MFRSLIRAGRIPVAAAMLSAIAASPAAAYSYHGPRTWIAACGTLPGCTVPGTGFVGVSIRGNWRFGAADPLVTFVPQVPGVRGGAVLSKVELYAVATGSQVTLLACNVYRRSDGSIFVIEYPVTDPVGRIVAGATTGFLDLRIYMSENQAWIESAQGGTALAQVWTAPLFFGFGPASGKPVDVRVSPNPGDWSAPPLLAYYSVEKKALVDDIEAKFAKRPDTSPFLFNGRASSASALASVIVEGVK